MTSAPATGCDSSPTFPAVHPIEAESMRRLAGMVDLSHLAHGPRAVVERVLHASADLEYARTMLVDEEAVAAGVEALRSGSPVVTDVEMTRAGLHQGLRYGTPTGSAEGRARCYLAEARRSVDAGGDTISARAMSIAIAKHPEGALFVVGCAPTALERLVDAIGAGQVVPALVIGLPVGFVGAAESKAALADCQVPFVTNVGSKGGSAVAAAAANALYRLSVAGVAGGDDAVASRPAEPAVASWPAEPTGPAETSGHGANGASTGGPAERRADGEAVTSRGGSGAVVRR